MTTHRMLKTFVNWLVSGGLIVTLAMSGRAATQVEFLPLEMPSKNLPINGNDVVNDPEGVAVKYGFSSATGNKIVEHGDSITLLDTFNGIETPHLEWAKPYANGPVRILCLVSPTENTRSIMELRQRSDFEFIIVQVPNVLSEPMKDGPAYFKKRILTRLEEKYDAIILPVGLLSRNTDYLMDKVMEKVQEGTGLILFLSSGQWWRTEEKEMKKILEVSPLKYGHGKLSGVLGRTERASPLTEAHSFSFWPSLSTFGGGTCKEGAMMVAGVGKSPILVTGAYGKGRVMAVAFGGGVNASMGILPNPDPEKEYTFGDWYESVYAFYLKALTWVAEKEPRVSMVVPEVIICKAGEKPKVSVNLKNLTGKKRRLRLDWILQDEWGVKLANGIENVDVYEESELVELKVPPCRINGLHRINLWLYDRGVVENWGTTTVRVDGSVDLKVESQEKPSAPGGVARYRISTGGAEGRLFVRGVDDMDRVFFDKTFDIKDGNTVDVETKRSCLPRNRIEFMFSDGKQVIARKFVQLYIPRIGLDSLDGDFVIASYGHTFAEDHLQRYMGMLYREAGLNAYYGNWHNRSYVRERATDLGLYAITGPGPGSPDPWPYMKQEGFAKALGSCPDNPATRAKWQKNIDVLIDDLRFYGGIGRVLDDESFFCNISYKDGEMQGAQACQCEYCMKLFREKMKENYQDITRLNEAWDTTFKSFDEVRVLEENEVKGKENPSGWLEFRQFMNWVYANQYYGWIQAQHQPLGASFGSGPGAPNNTPPTYKGGDYSFMKDTLRFMMAYGGSEARLYHQAFIGQPGGQKYDPPMEWRQHGSWYHLLNGADALWYYYGHAMIGNELAWRKQGEWVHEGISDVRDGLGVLVSGSKALDRQVRILYSSENMAMAWLFAKRKDDWNAFRSNVSESTFSILLDQFLFIQPSYVTEEEIQKGDLQDCRLLILPQAFNMDNATAEAIKQYVQKGGRVVADVLPATRERYGKPRAVSALAELFGVDATGAQLHKESEAWYSVGVGFKPGGGEVNEKSFEFGKERIWLPADTSFLNLKPTTAKIQGVVLSKEGKEANACFINSYGKGKTLLLNFLYCDLNSETSGWHVMFGKTLVDWADLKAPAQIVNPITRAPLAYRPLRAFQRGKALLLGSIRGGGMIWSGGRPILIDPSRTMDMMDQAKITWDSPCFVYNVRTHQYLGQVTDVTVDLPSFQGRLLALLPYKVERVELKAPSHAKAGELVALKARVVAANAVPDEHVLRLEVTSPTGYRNLVYCKTRTAHNGETVFQIPFADNDRKGDWKVVVRDVMTGVEGTTVIRLQL